MVWNDRSMAIEVQTRQRCRPAAHGTTDSRVPEFTPGPGGTPAAGAARRRKEIAATAHLTTHHQDRARRVQATGSLTRQRSILAKSVAILYGRPIRMLLLLAFALPASPARHS